MNPKLSKQYFYYFSPIVSGRKKKKMLYIYILFYIVTNFKMPGRSLTDRSGRKIIIVYVYFVRIERINISNSS